MQIDPLTLDLNVLERIRIIQIGDIHFPETASLGLPIDDKDQTFPRDMKNGLSRYPLKTVFRRIYDILAFRNAPPDQTDCVLFMGDATSYGDLEGYEQCIRFLSHSLQLGKSRTFSDIEFGVIPGNHDVNRKLFGVPGSDNRFVKLSEILNDHGLPALPVVGHIEISLARAKCKARVLLVNSCMGCGLKKYIPSSFQDALAGAIEAVIGQDSSEKALKEYFDLQMDTPAIEHDTIEAISGVLQESPENQLFVLAAHHNLLPQRAVRIAPYTELVNGGSMRDVLTSAGRPIIYLHGHIHDDPVEIIRSPNGYPIVCVSAPRADEGFNVVEVVFDTNHRPISCNIYPYRFRMNGVFDRKEPVKVPLVSLERAYIRPEIASLYAHLLAGGVMRYDELQKLPTTQGDQASLVDKLETLSACGLIDIKNYRSECDEWIIKVLAHE